MLHAVKDVAILLEDAKAKLAHSFSLARLNLSDTLPWIHRP